MTGTNFIRLIHKHQFKNYIFLTCEQNKTKKYNLEYIQRIAK